MLLAVSARAAEIGADRVGKTFLYMKPSAAAPTLKAIAIAGRKFCRFFVKCFS